MCSTVRREQEQEVLCLISELISVGKSISIRDFWNK